MVTSKDGTTIAVTPVGDGPAVVCVGGALNDRGSAVPLAGFTVYAYDRRGRGDSGDTQPYAVEREIEDLAVVIETAGGSAMVYGISSGAVLALRAAAAGVPITRLALFEPPLTATGPDPDYTARLAAAGPAEALELFLGTAMGMPPEALATMRETPAWPALEALAPTLRYDNEVMILETLPTTTVPTTILTGGASPTWMHEAAHRLATHLPNATTTTLPNETHNISPPTLAKALQKTLK
ncbi:alpha/beta fold hydrolase [Actinophytocola sp. NPDC049390]|uniref:alpha/beta fold hydrolase n=1 Tax=Actinophytocola sp. NPDC049390 TaxID=3363894 RepID=UPI0037B707D3